MLKQKVKRLANFRIATVSAVACLALVLFGTQAGQVIADQFSSQIQSLQTQNSQTQSSLTQLQLQATSYQDAINQLQQQISGIQAAIVSSQSEITSLQAQITQDQAQITYQKQVLSDDIRAMYVESQTTTLEVLASSNDLSQFVTKEVDRSAVQDKVTTTLNTITQLEQTLEQTQTQAQNLLASQQSQQAQLDSDRSQQSQLLGYNEGQQATYNQQIKNNNSQIAILRSQQAAANAAIAKGVNVASGSGNGACALSGSSYQGTGPINDNGVVPANYPDTWCNAAQDSLTTEVGAGTNRECTSFAYWYFVNIEGNSGFNVSGNAGAWWETSNYPAITWGSNVEVGALGVEPGTVRSNGSGAPVPSLHGSYYGHVMVVMALPGQSYDGVAVPSDYVMVASMNEDGYGHFMYNLWPVSYLMFINPQ